jgi:hypothetical protein
MAGGGEMTRHVLIFDDDYEAQYRLSRAYLDNKYHDQGTHLKDIPATDDTWYNNQAPQHRQHSTRPESMRVK